MQSLKQQQAYVHDSVTEAVSNICYNGLSFEFDIKIEGVIAVTVDGNIALAIHINELLNELKQRESLQDKLTPVDVLPLSIKNEPIEYLDVSDSTVGNHTDTNHAHNNTNDVDSNDENAFHQQKISRIIPTSSSGSSSHIFTNTRSGLVSDDNPDYAKSDSMEEDLETNYTLGRMFKRNTNLIHSCHLCSEDFNKRCLLFEHLEEHHEVTLEHCYICKKMFSSKTACYVHIQTVHLNHYLFNCSMCEYKCQTRLDYEGHMNKHNGIKPYSCKTCSRSFSTLRHMKTHVSRVHERKFSFKCPYCDICLLDSRTQARHIKKHRKSEPFNCNICSARFSSQKLLMEHLETDNSCDESSLLEIV